jgi:hypothetical protein
MIGIMHAHAKLAVLALAVLAGCGKQPERQPMSNSIAPTRADLEQVYRQHDPAFAGHQSADAVAVGADGITVLASANPKGETDHTWLLRLADDGTLAWDHHYEPGHGSGRALVALGRGFAIAGEVQRDAMAYQAALLRVDPAGAVVGATSLGPRGVTGFSAVTARGDDAIVAGGTTRSKGWIVTTDPALKQVGETTVDVDEIKSLAALPSGEVAALAAVEKSTTGFGRTRLAGLATDGTVRWAVQLPSSGRGDPAALAALRDGFLVAGNGAAGDRDPAHIWLARVDAAGKLLWEHALDGGPAAWRARAAAALPDGFAVAGEVAPPDGSRTPQVWRLTGDGEVRWQRALNDGQFINGLAATADGGLVVVGSTSHGAGKTNVWVVRLDPKGDVVWQRVFGSPPG